MPDVLGRRVPLSSAAFTETTAASVTTVAPDVEKLRVDILRAVRSVCPRWLADQADDLAQIAISRIVERQRMTDGRLELSPGYFYRTAYSVVIDEIRRRRRLQEVPLEQDLLIQANENNPERQAFSREVRDAVVKCLAKLAPPRRRAVTLHLMGHSVQEISALLECRHKQAENLVYRGLSNLRVCLKLQGVKE